MPGCIPETRDARFARLTAREQEVMILLVQGASAKLISRLLLLSPRTVDAHASSIIRKLGARNRTHAVALAVHAGIVSPELDLAEWPRQRAQPRLIATAAQEAAAEIAPTIVA